MTERAGKRVFVSYSGKDAAFARRLVSWLEERGFSVWLDKKTIKGGEDYFRSIANGIKQADAVVPILSPDSVSSPWVVRELKYAMERRKRIVPVFKEFAQLPEDLELIIAGLHRVDFSGAEWDADPWAMLDRALVETPGDRPEPLNPLTAAVQAWEDAGRSYAAMESRLQELGRWLEPREGAPADMEPGLAALMLLASLHLGRNWRHWTERNVGNGQALEALLSVVSGEVPYLRPRFRALYALQQFGWDELRGAVDRRAAAVPDGVRTLLETYVKPGKVGEYLDKIKRSGDPELGPKAAAVLREVERLWGVPGGGTGLPVV